MSMPLVIPNTFTKYNMSSNDLDNALLSFTDLQKMYIQNLLSDSAEQRLALDVNSNDVPKFIQDEAFLKGQIAAFRFILDSAEAAITSKTKGNK